VQILDVHVTIHTGEQAEEVRGNSVDRMRDMERIVQEKRGDRRKRTSIRIFVAERLPVTRYGIRLMISESPNMVVAGEAGDGFDTVAALRVGEYDVLIAGVDLPRLDGLDLVRQLRSEGVRVPVLIFSRLSEEDFAIRALKAGALGYLTKDAEIGEFVHALETVASGDRYVSPSLVQTIAVQIGIGVDQELHDLLSDRELEVMRSLALGRGVKEIAGELNLSMSTVSTYRSRVLAKMNMRKNSELTRYAIKHGLVE
jgi:DNA-binding NarL/FixJ family response regulator